MSLAQPRLAFVHATRLAIEPVEQAAAALWPEAETISLLDESLQVDRARTETLTPALHRRIRALADHAMRFDADAIQFTCSAFGAAIEAADAALPVPVATPNAAMFRAALDYGDSLALVYTFPPAARGMIAEFEELAMRGGRQARLIGILCEGAMDAKQAGDAARHDAMLARACEDLAGFDAILLAQFSMASAAPLARTHTDTPVLTSPEAAVEAMRQRVTAAGSVRLRRHPSSGPS